jgi:hypothetical protein
VAGVPEQVLDRYAEEGPAFERRGELPPSWSPRRKTSTTRKRTGVTGGSHRLLPEWNSQARIVPVLIIDHSQVGSSLGT